MGASLKVELVPIERINVINSRSRNPKVHREIVANIEAIGLKRPIKVSRRRTENGVVSYDLICGEGRLEAFQALGQTEIPAIVEDVDEETCLVQSLVENVARRQHRGIDLMQEVGNLRSRGYNDRQIAAKIGVTSAWVNMVAGLLERGEGRLVNAVESGIIPLSLAVLIARSDDAETQQALAEAYAQGKVKNKDVAAVRRLLDQRARSRKKHPETPFGRRNKPRALTADQLVRVYQREADRQRLLVKKADYAQTRLLFVIEALRDLLRDDAFVDLLQAEGLDTMPKALQARMVPEYRP